MIHRKGKLSKALMDRDWPHQVALPAHRCMGHEYLTIHIFCQAENLSLCRRRHTLRQNDIDMTVFCGALPSANMPIDSKCASVASS